MDTYKIPSQTRIGHVHLKVADLNRSLAFYRDLLGFEVTMLYGNQAAFISAGGYHHHIGLNTWHSKGVGYNLSENNNNLLVGYGFIYNEPYVSGTEDKINFN